MEEHQRMDRVDQHPGAIKIDLVIADIPGGKVGADVLDDSDPRRKARK
jgi:hypothetical protein